ncbi:histidine phosphatase family protein [Clostridium aciditolerans]|uniref:Histidine phosphatase family protein n=1 Tax=Clostridium aciditolerans TaxID=339861 RepID=A0A934M5G9_9CLOT|nr:histidine phosphatase family protein [Clostridium aciditolerans]MBI6872011.1 histidine phosphatase family protein [Clostridium aciditolerans]
MKIGLIRHFKVNLKKSRFMSSKEYNKYISDYDISEVIPNEIVVDKEWDKCYCSSLSRAVTTAKTVYDGELIITDKLVEIPSAAWRNIRFKIPYTVWTLLNRLAWIRNHVSQPEGRKTTLKRVNEILDTILKEKDKNILIVSHAGTLYEVQKILIKKGFRGNYFLKPRNGKLYVFENKRY